MNMAEIRDATANLTLGEIRSRNVDNFQLVMDECKPYRFDTQKEANNFLRHAHNIALRKLGVNADKVMEIAQNAGLTKETKKERIDKIYKDHDIWIEHREYKGTNMQLVSGFYFRHGNEISYFLSDAIAQKTGKSRDSRIIVMSRIQWLVITNIPV